MWVRLQYDLHGFKTITGFLSGAFEFSFSSSCAWYIVINIKKHKSTYFKITVGGGESVTQVMTSVLRFFVEEEKKKQEVEGRKGWKQNGILYNGENAILRSVASGNSALEK